MSNAFTIIGLKISKSDLKPNGGYIKNYTKLDNVDGQLQVNSKIYLVTKIHVDDDSHYVLLYEGSHKSKCPYTLEDLCKMKDEMKTNLTEINLWDAAKFGIYTDEFITI